MKVVVIDHPRDQCMEHFNDVANAPLSASLNSGYACAVATQCGCEVEHLDFLSMPATADEIARRACSGEPDLLLFHWVYDWGNGQVVTETIASIKREAGLVLIGAFGFFPTFCGTDLLEANAGLDFVLTGEFEGSLIDLLSGTCDISGDGIRTRNGFRPRPPASDPDLLPWPEDVGKTSDLMHLNVAASRGCYGNCTFCCIGPFYSCGAWRPRAVERVREEIEHRLSARKLSQVYFVDPNFMGPGRAGQDRTLHMASELKNLDLTFGLEARVNDIEPDTVAALKDAGLRSVFLGVESGSQAVLKRMRKGITPDQSSRAISILRTADVDVIVGFIMFDPDSTITDLQDNFEFLQQNNLLSQHSLTANVLYHSQIILKGTPSFAHYTAQGQLTVSQEAPYEGRVRYRDEKVGTIADCMQDLTLHYFRHLTGQRHGVQDGEEWCAGHAAQDDRINIILCSTFRDMLRSANRPISALRDITDQGIADLAAVFASNKVPPQTDELR